MLSYSDYHCSYFKIGNKSIKYNNPYKKHLPSFSSAILHFGTCRDLYFILLKIYLIEKKQLLQDDFGKITKMGNKYDDINDFICDIVKLNGKDNSDLIEKGKIVFNNNLLRNVCAHKMRLPWWENELFSSNDFFLKKDMYEYLQKKEKVCKVNQEIMKIIKDTKKYEEEIEKSNNRNELISATEILKDIHNSLAEFINLSFGVMNLKLFHNI